MSLGSGFVGGQIFPCIFIGASVGEVWSLAWPAWPRLLTVPCLMSAVPCAFAPIPFAMVGIVEMSFVLGGPMTAPVFVASFVAFLTNCGVGVVQRIAERSIQGAVRAVSSAAPAEPATSVDRTAPLLPGHA